MDQTKKFQWSKFSPDRTEQFVIRTENWQEVIDYRARTNALIGAEETLPVAKTPEVQKVAVVAQPVVSGHVCSTHGPMVYKEGVSKTGKPYKVWSCPARLPNGSYCDQKEWVS